MKVDIWSLGQVVASLECGLPEYKEAWTKDAVAWIRAVREHVNDHEQYYQDQDTELLYFLLDNILVGDPKERSSTDYCHDETWRLSKCDSRIPFLQRIKNTRRRKSTPSDTESSDDDDDGSSTSKSSILQSDVESESADEASTIRVDPQFDSRDGSETPSRKTVEFINSLVNPTESEEWQRSGAPDPDTQPSQVPITSVILPQRRTVDGLLWNPEDFESGGLTSKHDGEATKAGAGEAQTKGLSDEDHDISFFIRYHPGGEVPGDAAQDAVETSGVGREGLYRSIRKRSWPEETSSLPFTRGLIHPLSSDQQRAVNRDIPSNKGPPNHKRSKKGE